MKNKLQKIILIILIVILLIGALFCIFYFFSSKSKLNFAALSDSHIANFDKTTYSDIVSSKILLAEAVNKINSLKNVDFVIFSGDLVNRSKIKNWQNFYNLANNLKIPYYIAFGNHDFYGLSQKEVMETAKKNNPYYNFNETFYSFDYKKNYHIIFLDSTIKKDDTACGFVDDNELKFLNDELSKNKNKVILIVLHHPLIPPYENKSHILLNSSEVLDIISKYKNPIIILSGHFHSAKIIQKENVLFISNPSLVTYPMAFRQIEIKDFRDKTKINVKYFQTNFKDLREKNKLNHQNPAILEGSMKDKINSFVIYKNKKDSK